jgi:hypothetical protein
MTNDTHRRAYVTSADGSTVEVTITGQGLPAPCAIIGERAAEVLHAPHVR